MDRMRGPLEAPTRALLCALAGGLLATAAVASAAAEEPLPPPAGLHVPSPDWRDQVVYFAMIDRFHDGDPGNNDQGAGEYDPADHRRYSGGDLAGLARRLDYIQGLGATALWITPPVANQWWNPGGGYGGYHGYWASDFSAVDAHYGTLDDYRALSRALHGRGMRLVQDIVVNHVADWIRCGREVDPGDDASIARHCRVRTDAQGRSAPVQPPFDRNDPQNPAHRRAGLYHFTPGIADFSERRQELDFALADLDDLNTENPVVRRALRAAYGHWIRAVGVDAFRVDTAFHVPAEFFPDFLHAADPEAPGVVEVARATGRDGFLSFGEGFGSDRPFADAQAHKLDAYMRVPGGLPSMINFPLYGTLGDVFARGRPTAELRHRIGSMLAVHADPHRMPTFIDNHDVDRFLAGAGEPALKQALLAMLTLPGIPVVYYGTEQGFTERRASMFAAGHGSGDRDHFDATAPLYRYLQRAIALRREHRLFSRGIPTVVAANPARAGAIAWRTDYDAATDTGGHRAPAKRPGDAATRQAVNPDPPGTAPASPDPSPASGHHPLSRTAGEGRGEGALRSDAPPPFAAGNDPLSRTAGEERGEGVLPSDAPPPSAAGNNPLSRTAGEGWGEGRASALVVFNTADTPTLLDSLDTGLPPGTHLQPLFAIDGTPAGQIVDAHGRLTLVLPPRSGQVWKAAAPTAPAARGEAAGRAPAAPASDPISLTLSFPRPPPSSAAGAAPRTGSPQSGEDDAQAPVFRGDIPVAGRARPHRSVQLVVDGDLARARSVRADATGRWQATLRTDDMVDPAIVHQVVAFDPGTRATSPARPFRVALDWQPAADIADPRGDDSGPAGRYTYPADPGWREARPADIERVRAWTAGGALRFSVALRDLSTAWNPANGFDHVAITAFLELPGRDGGARVLPLQNASLPDGMRWHYRLRAHGWSNALFASTGASASHEGAPVTPAATIATDPARDTVTFTIPASALGHPESLSGAKLYLNTWDYDAGYRALRPQAQPAAFGGGDGTTDALEMDRTKVIGLR